jgi:hypothetical protein
LPLHEGRESLKPVGGIGDTIGRFCFIHLFHEGDSDTLYFLVELGVVKLIVFTFVDH